MAYLVTGTVYYLAGYVYRLFIGKPNTFSPIIGLPLTIMGWPQMLYADFVHHEVLGIKPSFVLTVLTLIIVMIYFIWRAIKHK
ncbi:MAG: hypothetical protein U9R53_00355 [Chloroflexota bacterium]|nr:hypothetical protein [Chloroflexota bacterium]